MEKFYITENLFLENKQLFLEDNDKIKKIKGNNWHIILKDYGWEKLNLKWIKKLNSLTKLPPKNSRWGILECGSDGDCLFHCLSYALKSENIIDGKFNVANLRQMVSKKISKDKFNEIINIYKILKDSDDFEEVWDPYDISFDEFKKLIIQGGDNYWGDNIIINILKEILNINIIILNSNSLTNDYNYYPLLYDFDDNCETIILSYEEGIHFKLIGYFDDFFITKFNKKNIPNEILKLINYLR